MDGEGATLQRTVVSSEQTNRVFMLDNRPGFCWRESEGRKVKVGNGGERRKFDGRTDCTPPVPVVMSTVNELDFVFF